MKKMIKFTTLLLAGFVGITTAKAAAPVATTAIIDVNRILSESKAAKGLNDQMNTLRAEYEKDIYKQEEALRTQEKKLESLKGDALEKSRKELETNVAQFQKTIMAQQTKLQKAAQDAMDKIREKVINIANKVGKGKGYVYIQPAAGFLYFPPETDITTATIELLDKELPEIKIVVPKDNK